MTTIAHTVRPALRLLERRPAQAPSTVAASPRPTLMQRIERWFESLPEPRRRHKAAFYL